MINLSFNIASPREIDFKNYWSRAWATPFKNKFVELEVYTISSIIGFDFRWTRRRDHAGVDIELCLLGRCLHFNFYDNRHWDDETDSWKVYD